MDSVVRLKGTDEEVRPDVGGWAGLGLGLQVCCNVSAHRSFYVPSMMLVLTIPGNFLEGH